MGLVGFWSETMWNPNSSIMGQSSPLDLVQLLETRLKKAGEGERKEKENTTLAEEKGHSM